MRTSHTIIFFFVLISILASFLFVPYKSHFDFVVESKEKLERGGAEVIQAVLGMTDGKAEVSCEDEKTVTVCSGGYDTKNLYEIYKINNNLRAYVEGEGFGLSLIGSESFVALNWD